MCTGKLALHLVEVVGESVRELHGCVPWEFFDEARELVVAGFVGFLILIMLAGAGVVLAVRARD